MLQFTRINLPLTDAREHAARCNALRAGRIIRARLGARRLEVLRMEAALQARSVARSPEFRGFAVGDLGFIVGDFEIILAGMVRAEAGAGIPRTAAEDAVALGVI